MPTTSRPTPFPRHPQQGTTLPHTQRVDKMATIQAPKREASFVRTGSQVEDVSLVSRVPLPLSVVLECERKGFNDYTIESSRENAPFTRRASRLWHKRGPCGRIVLNIYIYPECIYISVRTKQHTCLTQKRTRSEHLRCTHIKLTKCTFIDEGHKLVKNVCTSTTINV